MSERESMAATRFVGDHYGAGRIGAAGRIRIGVQPQLSGVIAPEIEDIVAGGRRREITPHASTVVVMAVVWINQAAVEPFDEGPFAGIIRIVRIASETGDGDRAICVKGFERQEARNIRPGMEAYSTALGHKVPETEIVEVSTLNGDCV